MGQVEADRLHAGLIGSFAEVLPRIEGGRVDERAGYRVTICPAIPVPVQLRKNAGKVTFRTR